VGSFSNNITYHRCYLLLNPIQRNHLACNEVNGKRFETITILQFPDHIVWELTFDSVFAIWALLYLAYGRFIMAFSLFEKCCLKTGQAIFEFY
jgi:hypothetical protein